MTRARGPACEEQNSFIEALRAVLGLAPLTQAEPPQTFRVYPTPPGISRQKGDY